MNGFELEAFRQAEAELIDMMDHADSETAYFH